MSDWLPLLAAKLAAGIPVVRMAVASVRGSAPREPGATLLYWVDEAGRTRSHGTIGGGHLEARALEIADHLLRAGDPTRRVERFSLGASLGQCCGGVVELYWEHFLPTAQALCQDLAAQRDGLRYCAMDGSGREWLLSETAAREAGLPGLAAADRAGLVQGDGLRYFVERLRDDATELWLYGAGHVGKALVQVLADLPFRITWVDSRPEMLTEALAQWPDRHIRALAPEYPDEVVAEAPAGAWHLVMTHSHELDLRLCEALLKIDNFGFFGVIGSATKEARFRHRLLQKGCSRQALARMVCPIGVAGIRSKLPAAIAVGVAAQLLQQREVALRQNRPDPLSSLQGALAP